METGGVRMGYLLKAARRLLLILAVILVALLLLFNYFFFSMHRLPKGEYITEAVSPSADYTVRTYLTNGGATVAHAVRGEVIFHEKKNKKKNIYWQYREEKGDIVWLDDHTVLINDVELDVRRDIYDYRKEK